MKINDMFSRIYSALIGFGFAVATMAAAQAPQAPIARWDTITPTRTTPDFKVHVDHLRPGQVRSACRAAGMYEGKPACYEYDAKTNTCTVHTFEPADVGDRWTFEAIGHAFWHCYAGEYHMEGS